MEATRLVGYFSDPEISEITGVAHSGANAVAMGPYCIMEHWNDSNAGRPVGSVAQFTQAMQSARAQGLRILLKPIIDCSSYRGDPDRAGWRAAIDPADIDAWMTDYYAKCFEPYLGLVDMVAVHTELVTISATYPAQMISLIQQIRFAGFSGPIATSNDLNPLSSPYWTALDIIGGDAYPSIRSDSMSHAVADWTALAEQAAVAHTQTGCNIMFGELLANYGSRQTPYQNSLVYQAFWEVFGNLPYFAGAFAWRWPQNGTTPAPSLMSSLSGGLKSYPTYVAPGAVG
jgi:hypothetical protein